MEYAIAIDMGGTNIRGAIIDEKQKFHLKYSVPTEANKGKNQVITNIGKVIKYLKKEFNAIIRYDLFCKNAGICKTGGIQI